MTGVFKMYLTALAFVFALLVSQSVTLNPECYQPGECLLDIVLADMVPADRVPADMVPAVPDIVPADMVPAVPDMVPADMVPAVADMVPADMVPAVPDIVPADMVPAVPDMVPADMVPADMVPSVESETADMVLEACERRRMAFKSVRRPRTP